MKAFQMFCCAILGSLLVVGAGPAMPTTASEEDECHRVKAVGVGQDLGGGNTTATISHAGFLNGITTAHFDITGGTLPVLTFEGTVVFRAKHGTLTVNIAGTFNVATGAFEASGYVRSGTGKFAGAIGTLTFSGVEDFSTGVFTETITGRICLDEADDDG